MIMIIKMTLTTVIMVTVIIITAMTITIAPIKTKNCTRKFMKKGKDSNEKQTPLNTYSISMQLSEISNQ